ncbi:MAG TPA: GNAT family N-acetyltransferase [Fimbriimonadaceae bacterium]|nr:GNAT family N-acetyltransferase [Fimbriimonadaceae bacterium]
MTIRPIAPDEAAEFLDLMCTVFDLEVERAKSVFYKEPLFDLERKWAVFSEGDMVSILTTVPLRFGWGRAFGIAGVATREDRRGLGFASKLLQHVCAHGESTGEGAAYLFAREPSLYRGSGFAIADTVIKGSLDRMEEDAIPAMLDGEAVEARYAAWAGKDPNRLRRDDQRWRYWRWSMRVCTEFGDGYLCSEGSVVREVVIDQPVAAPWQTPDAEWFGLESMTKLLSVPVTDAHFELYLMARNGPSNIGMFMTDQF